MKIALEMTRGPVVADGVCRRRARNTLTLGTLAISAVGSVVLLATQSSLKVQLIALSATAVIGLYALRGRAAVRIVDDEAPEVFARTQAMPAVHQSEPLRQQRLAQVGKEMLARTRRLRQPLTVAVFDFSDLPELQAVFAGDVARDLGPMIARKLKAIARTRAVVVRTGKTTFTVLLPNFDSARARNAIATQFGKACCMEFAVGNEEILLVPDFLVQTVQPGTASVDDVYRMLRGDLLKGQQNEERRQANLKNERESYSRPKSPAAMPPMAPTMPAPLGMR